MNAKRPKKPLIRKTRSLSRGRSPAKIVVALGASAGGLEALQEFFTNIPIDTGMAFVIVQHMDPSHESMLKDIIGRITKIPTMEVKNAMPLVANRIYVIPPNKNMKIVKSRFRLAPREEGQGIHLPVNCFFSSLAKDQGAKAVGIILSGSANDGVIGQQEIKACGGITFCQSPESAKYKGMPESAIQSGAIDFILRPKAIARKLIGTDLRAQPIVKVKKEKDIKGLLRGVKGDLPKILFLLKYFTGLDFSLYKKSTMERRIARRMSVTRKATIREYLNYVNGNAKEIDALFADLLINVTSFFRDPGTFQVLKKKVFPRLLKGRSLGQSLRIWVPACSTGEEVYSLAISLLESLGNKEGRLHLQLFGTDVNEAVIIKARKGVFAESIKSQMPSTILRRYFTKEISGYKIIKSVRDMCVFAKHDLTSDPPFSKLDLVSCRNMLIYVQPSLQEKIIPLLHYSLDPKGFLILGKSETLGPHKDLFDVVDKTFRIFSRNSLPLPTDIFTGRMLPRVLDVKPPRMTKKVSKTAVAKTGLKDKTLQDADEEIRCAYEEMQSTNEELQSTNEELETSKEELQSTNEELATLNDELTDRNAKLFELSSDIQNLFNSTQMPVIMVDRNLFIRRFTPTSKKVWNLIDADIGRPISDINAKIRINGLRKILLNAIDHLETSRAEVKDSSGHFYSMSVFPYKTIENVIDGAVITFNDITLLKRAQRAVEISKEYFENIVKGIPTPVVVMDKQLHVKTVNPTFCDMFKVSKEKAESKFIYELNNSAWNMPKLIKRLKMTGSRKVAITDFEVHLTFKLIGERVLVINSRIIKEKITGEERMLMCIEDITDRRSAVEKIKALSRFPEENPSPVLRVTKQGKVLYGNEASKSLLAAWDSGIGGSLPSQWRKIIGKAFKSGRPLEEEFIVKDKIFLLNIAPIKDEGYANIYGRDISESRKAEKEKEILSDEVDEKNKELEQILYAASHDLRTPLVNVKGYVKELELSLKDLLNSLKDMDIPQTEKDRINALFQEDISSFMKYINGGTSRMNSLIEGLLCLSRLGRGPVKIHKIDIKRIVAEVMRDMKLLAERTKVQIDIAALPDCMGDEIMVSAVFSNLIGNALKYLDPKRTGIIKISGHKKGSRSLYVVEDNGIGIDPSHFEKIFRVFHRLDPAKSQGEGMGLALVRWSLNRLQGKIWLNSEPGKGSKFFVSLPGA